MHSIDNKNSEIIKLNIKIQELEKTNITMLQELENYENEFQLVQKKFSAKENQQKDKIQILEMEKLSLQNKLDYYQKLFPKENPENKEVFFSENDNIKENVLILTKGRHL